MLKSGHRILIRAPQKPFLVPGGFRFEEHLTNLNELNTAVNQKVLDLRELVSTLADNFRLMQDEFNLSQPPKLHIIQNHYFEHFELT